MAWNWKGRGEEAVAFIIIIEVVLTMLWRSYNGRLKANEINLVRRWGFASKRKRLFPFPVLHVMH